MGRDIFKPHTTTMQYLLTQDEYDSLKRQATELDREAKESLQTACTLVADHMPIRKPWDGEEGEPLSPWGCIFSTRHEHYCDGCPVRNICPSELKNWSQ